MEDGQPAKGDGLSIVLMRHPNPAPKRGEEPKKVVLLVHGASASRHTFEQKSPGLIGYLNGETNAKHVEPAVVYTVDWRSSMETADDLVEKHEPRLDTRLFTLDAAVGDLVEALKQVKAATDVEPKDVRIVGHCIGGALVAQAIAQGLCPSEHVVLTSLALFFKVGVEGWLKGNDFVLEKQFASSGDPPKKPEQAPKKPPYPIKDRIISAKVAREPKKYEWPTALEDRYRFWLGSGLHHGCGNPFCERISFMYGMPFRLNDMKDLHDEPGGLEQQFGSMPLGIYAHCLRNLRRGWAAKYDAAENEERELVDEAARRKFAGRHITLITGNENQVWHRNSMDLMHEWLGNGRALPGLHLKKHVLRGYGHQDLYWSSNAPNEVYPLIAEGLGLLRPKSG
jgi:pimeloyl-ACP methyl ester carboxylesterase